MKNNLIKYIAVIVFLFPVIGCDDFLDIENEEAFTSETLLDIPEGMDQLLNGIYTGFLLSGNFDFRFGMFHYSMPGTDIAYERPGTPAFRQNIDRFVMNGSDNRIPGRKFDAVINVIGRANQVLSVIPNSSLSQEERNAAEAEARFLRAFAYFDGVRTWGDLPIVTSSPATVSEAFGLTDGSAQRSPVQDVFEQVIFPDLIFAVEHLPGEERLPGAPTSWAARGMLAKAYMQAAGQFRIAPSDGGSSYWERAIAPLQEIISDGPYGLTPGTNYSELYNVDFEGANTEKIWVLKFGRNVRGGGYAIFWFTPQNFAASDAIYLQNPDRRVLPESNVQGSRQNLQVYEDFYNSFDPLDLRRDVAIRDYTFNLTDDDGNLLTGNTRWPWGVNKYNYDVEAFNSNSSDGTDRIMLRLADVHLLLAEAINEVNGPTPEAFEQINIVRRRAGLNDLSAADIIDGHFTYGNGNQSLGNSEGFRFAILRERAWELCFEYHRRFDLNRHGYLDDAALNRWGTPGEEPTNKNYPPIIDAFTPGHELFPLPDEQVILNGWTQNPGY